MLCSALQCILCIYCAHHKLYLPSNHSYFHTFTLDHTRYTAENLLSCCYIYIHTYQSHHLIILCKFQAELYPALFTVGMAKNSLCPPPCILHWAQQLVFLRRGIKSFSCESFLYSNLSKRDNFSRCFPAF